MSKGEHENRPSVFYTWMGDLQQMQHAFILGR